MPHGVESLSEIVIWRDVNGRVTDHAPTLTRDFWMLGSEGINVP